MQEKGKKLERETLEKAMMKSLVHPVEDLKEERKHKKRRCKQEIDEV